MKLKPLAVIQGTLDIVAPLVTAEDIRSTPLRVTNKSLKQHRDAVYKMAQYFRRELHYDFVQYGPEETESELSLVAFLWLAPDVRHLSNDFRVPAVGATCFRWREWQNHPAGWAMDWIWMHPYFRRRGLLSASWLNFRDEFGDFVCEQPISASMKHFLEKMGYPGGGTNQGK